jgi:DNA invertase Pin-like site-specific DNA recombinase
MISQRTKDALASAKSRGVKLGGHRAWSDVIAREAAERAEAWRSVFEELSDLSARKAAAELNRRGIPSAAGGKWQAVQVIRVRGRLN